MSGLLASLKTGVLRFSILLSGDIERRRAVYLAAFSMFFLGLTSLIAASSIMWFDELSTFYHSRLSGFSAIYNALKLGGDNNPPLYFFSTHICFMLLGETHLATRLAAILGFWLMSFCIFKYVSFRTSALYGFLAIGLILVSSVAIYAYEGRPYGMLLGWTALALLCWQRAGQDAPTRSWGAAGLAFAMACAVSTHYFALLLWIPVAAGELARTLRMRRVRIAIWTAMAIGALPLIWCLPLIRGTQAAVADHFWSRPSFALAFDSYRSIFTLLFAPFTAALLLWGLLAGGESPRDELKIKVPPEEIAAPLFLAALPFFGTMLGILVGGYVPRHTLTAVVGIAILFAFLSFSRTRGSAVWGTIFVITFFGWYGVKSVVKARAARHEQSSYSGKAWVRYAAGDRLPVVLTNSVFFIQAQHYAPQPVKDRIHYLADPSSALRYDGMTTGDRLLLIDRTFAPLKVDDYRTFAASHSRFLVCANLNQPTWLLSKLLDDGATLTLKSRDDLQLLFEVNLKP